MTTPDDIHVRVWTALATVSRVVFERIEADLKAAGLPSLSWYDALREVERAGPDGIRPFALRPKLLLPQYATSRLLDRLVRDGLVERRACVEDGRGHSLVITESGRELRQKMWDLYGAAIEREIGQTLSGPEAKTLAELLLQLGRVADPE